MEMFTKQPGTPAQSVDDESMFLIGGVPDVVRVPPLLGGGLVRVTGSRVVPCPLLDCANESTELQLGAGFGVIECLDHGFLWVQRSEP